MADVIDYRIFGDDMQIVEIELDPNEAVRAEVGAMLYMDREIKMQTTTDGGIFSGLKRMVMGENFFISSFMHAGARGKAKVAFAAPYPGKIVPLNLEESGPILCQKDAFLCAAAGIDIDIAFTKRLGAGIFGGEGFILQRLSGDGYAFAHAGGTILKRELNAGEQLRLDTGSLVALQEGMSYDIQFIGGFRNALFSGEGLFLTTIEGPGTVYLQSLPFSKLVDRISASIQFPRHD